LLIGAAGTVLAGFGIFAPQDARADSISICAGTAPTDNLLGCAAGVLLVNAQPSPQVAAASTTQLAAGDLSNAFSHISWSAVGSPPNNEPAFNTNTISITAATGTTLFLWITEQGLTTPPGNLLSTLTVNQCTPAATCGGTVQGTTMIDPTNGLFGADPSTQQLAQSGIIQVDAPAPGSGLKTPTGIGAIYSLTTEYDMTFATPGTSQSNTINISQDAIPEPASLALVSTGLLGLAYVVPRRRSKS
jgi:hypothetical protein